MYMELLGGDSCWPNYHFTDSYLKSMTHKSYFTDIIVSLTFFVAPLLLYMTNT